MTITQKQNRLKAPPKQVTMKIAQYTQTDLHELIVKDIYWMLTRDNGAAGPSQLSKQIQLKSFYLKVYYGEKTYMEVLFPNNVSVKFGQQYFENYSPMKFTSLVYLIIDRFGPIRNPMAFQIQTVRQQIGLYRNYNPKNVLRLSLKSDPVYQTLLCMARNFSDV